MNTTTAIRSILLALLATFSVARAANPSPLITDVQLRGNELFLTWTNGRPAYQVQMRSDMTGPWLNIGGPISQTSAMVSMSGSQAFFRVVSDFTARYKVVFNATWSLATHPTAWPANAHWSGLVGGTHNANVHFWREGETASEGIRLMAERGQQPTLLSEIAPAIKDGTAHLQLAGGSIATSPGSVAFAFPQPMRRDFPLVTLVTMIAPSPDWFAGVDSLSLVQDGEWVTNFSVYVYGYDAGTDGGPSYASPDQVTVPRGVVQRFSGFPALQNGLVMPFGNFVFTRLD